MDYNTVMAQKGADTKKILDEKHARLNDRNYYEKLKTDINEGRHANWTDLEKEEWPIVNARFNGPTNSAVQKQADSLSSQMPLVPTSADVQAATGATPEEQVTASQETSGLLKDSNRTNVSGVINEGASASETAGNRADERAQAIQDMLKNRYGAVEDYYSGSMSDAWKNLSDTDKKILLFDQLGTTLKNMSKARLPMYSAYGKSYEGQGIGEEKSMLQNMLDTSLQKGLERRNTRLDNQMKKQLEVANFPADLEMNLTQMWESGKLSNRQKAHLIDVMKNVDFMDALKAGAVSIAANGSIVNAATGTVLGHL